MTSPSTTDHALREAIGVANFFRAAADRIKRADALTDRIAAKRHEVETLNPVTDTTAWVAAVVELVDLVVEAREPRRSL